MFVLKLSGIQKIFFSALFNWQFFRILLSQYWTLSIAHNKVIALPTIAIAIVLTKKFTFPIAKLEE